MNIFIEHIYSKKKYNLINWIKYRLFLRKLDKVVPNFGMLWQIADFVKILEKVYMYDNSTNSELYSSPKYNEGENGFILNIRENSDVIVTINMKMYSDSETIDVELRRVKGNKMTTKMRLHEDSIINNTDDKQLIININDWIMNAAKKLVVRYYNLK